MIDWPGDERVPWRSHDSEREIPEDTLSSILPDFLEGRPMIVLIKGLESYHIHESFYVLTLDRPT